jgi:phospholipid/cholesterol/gamma-HCH transport system substrate-binding protein
MSSAIKYKLYGLALLALVAAFVLLCLTQYLGGFTPAAPITVRADRSGLQMYPGNRVQLRGVDVGKVGAVTLLPDGKTADITLRMDPKTLLRIPSNVNVSFDQLTVFGAKTVSLTDPPGPPATALRAGAVLNAQRVTIEVNSLFQDLTKVLVAAKPAQVSSVLGNLAAAVNGRGDKIGQTAVQLDDYLRKFNTDLPALQHDFGQMADVTNLYADVTPDLGRLVADATAVSRTIVDKQHDLDKSLNEVSRFAGSGNDFLDRNGADLINLVQDAIPLTSLLKDYSPEYKCLLQGIDRANRELLPLIGGSGTGIDGIVAFEPAQPAYKYPQNLPVMRDTEGPGCHGLPTTDGRQSQPALSNHVDPGGGPANDHTNGLTVADQPLAAYLFGPEIGKGAPLDSTLLKDLNPRKAGGS